MTEKHNKLHNVKDTLMKTRSEKLKAINEMFWRVSRCCESTHNWEPYLELHRAEEKSHRRFCPDHVQCGLTMGQSVKLFAVKELLEIITGEQVRPACEDYFHIRKSIFACWGIFKDCGEKLRDNISAAEAKNWLTYIDYAELNKDPRQEMEAA